MKSLIENLRESLSGETTTLTEAKDNTKNIIKSIQKNRDMKKLMGNREESKLIELCVKFFNNFYGDEFIEISSDEQCEDIMWLRDDILADYEDVEDALDNCTIRDLAEISDASGREYNVMKYCEEIGL